ncbi:MAG: hypothetical protein EBS21_02515 [Sphingomonadaceae bacterium]|nr:hypothetical protein [Sphingomonadaceae bacterium]
MEDPETDEGPAHEAAEKELLLKVQSILTRIDQWRTLSYHADRRYAELLRHFNGGYLQVFTDPKTGVDMAHYANFNVARSRLLKISRERRQPYFGKLGIFDVKLTKPELKAMPGLELACNEALSKIIRSDGRMTPHYRANVEDAILTGRGVMWRKMKTQLVPERGRLLAHPDAIAATKDDSLGEWAFASTVKAAELFRIAKDSKDEGIKSQAESLLKAIVKRHSPEQTPLNWPLATEPWEVFDATLRLTEYGRRALDTVIPCFWYFEKDLSGPPSERPVSVYCVARHGVDLSIVTDDSGKVSSKKKEGPDAAEGMIYRKEKCFASVSECCWLFTIGEQFGGEPTLGRIKGEGEIQYAADIRIQKMLNSMLRRIEVENMTLFKNSGASKRALDDLASNPLRDQDVIPEGIDFIERRFGDKPLSGMMQFVGLLSGYAADHAAVDTGHTDSPREENFKDQVLERMNDRVAAKTITESEWGDCLDPVADTIGYLIFDAVLVKADQAWEFREMFFKELKAAGFEMAAKDFKDGVSVSARRLPGHGDMAVAMARADANIALAQMTGPEAVARAVFEKAVLVAGGDVQKAAALLGGIPGGPKAPEGMDVHNAQMQMASILAAGVQLTPQADDNPFIHTAVQMTLLEGALAGYQQDGGWSKNDMRCWDAALAHAIADVMRIPIDKAKQASIQRIKALQATASGLPVFDQGQPPIDPVDAAKLQLAQDEQARKREKDQTAQERWVRTQMHREERDADMLALQQHSVIASNSRLDKEQSGKQASRQLSDAIALNEATAPEPKPKTTSSDEFD